MTDIKEIFYNWGGANEWLFRRINGIHSPWYDQAMTFISNIADHHRFPYYFVVIALYAGLASLRHLIMKRENHKQYIARWFGVLTVLLVSYGAYGFTLGLLKTGIHNPRPYIALHDVTVLPPIMDSGKDYESTPSGHTSFITVMILSLLPVLSGDMLWIGELIIFAVAWSRIAVGAHFPADVFYGFLFGCVIVWLVRKILYTLYRTLFGLDCGSA